jgi:hypothetical protein
MRGTVLHSAMMQSVIPRRYFTRVTTVLGSVSIGAMPLGSLLSGFLAVKWRVRAYWPFLLLNGCSFPFIG